MKPLRIDNEGQARPSRFAPWNRFWFTPADPLGLHTLRVLTGLLLLGWLLPFAGYQDALFSLGGWLDQAALQAAAEMPNGPPVGWSILYLAGDNLVMVDVIYWLSILVLVLFTLGIAVRLTAILAWVVTVSFIANPVTSYDADFLLVIPTFYLMLGYLFYGQYSRHATPLERLLGPREACATRLFRSAPPEAPSYAANFFVRLFQVHFALVIIVSALHKLQMADWWSGAAFFYPLHPPFQTKPEDVRALLPNAPNYLFFLSLGQYIMLGWQLGFPFFAWKKSFRIVLIGGGVIGWIGAAFLYGMPLFGPFTLLGCISYLTTQELRGAGRWIWSVLPGTRTAEPEKPRPPSPSSRSIKEVKRV